MAQMKLSEPQMAALTYMNERMDMLKAISGVPDSGPTGGVTVTIGQGKGKKKPPTISFGAKDKETQVILTAVSNYKKRLIKEIVDKFKKFPNTEFSEEELRLLEGAVQQDEDDESEACDADIEEEAEEQSYAPPGLDY